MPGILPMKMIKVGNSNQSRIAQACDRCRSKKIRCDGVRPCCSQCANVGFECKTSDKLSRRAFPRGYTESLEDRVRVLEAEVRELKDLLDEKDEKIDMLSRLHSFSPIRKNSASLSPANSARSKSDAASTHEEVLHVEIPAPVHPAKSSSAGSSTTSALIDAFERKVQEAGRQLSAIASSDLLTPVSTQVRTSSHSNNASVAPPRLLSDQYINLFFQEWQPLLPILHRQTFLRFYEQFLSEPDARSLQANKIAMAQLFLIFEIAAHSCSSKARPNTTSYELQWRKALSATSSAASLPLLQCHVLAQVAYLLKADYPHLLRHRASAVSICHQLGLHQGHKYFAINPFELETRKKVFWCQFVIDKYASAVTGVPVLLRESDVSTDYPADVDDENISEQGISPALPGELTKVSSALALFRMSRILSKTLEHLYPSSASYSISLKKLHSLSDELDQWHEELPDHLRLRFCNDKPATNLISDRSPLLSLAYFHTRSLIHRPLLCHGSGSSASAATIVLAAAAKHTAQIIDLLDERRMNYSFPINKQDLLIGSGFSILWQCIDLEDDSKIVKDNQKSLQLLFTKITRENSAASTELQKIVSAFIGIGSPRAIQPKTLASEPPAALFNTMPAPAAAKQKSTKKQLQAVASRFSNLSAKDKTVEQVQHRIVPSSKGGHDLSQIQLGSPHPRASSTISLASTQSAPLVIASTPSPRTSLAQRPSVPSSSVVNLDYFQLGSSQNAAGSSHNSSSTMLPPKTQSAPPVLDDWEQLVPGYDASFASPYNTVEPTALNKESTCTPEFTEFFGGESD